jgi:hypothetical protein
MNVYANFDRSNPKITIVSFTGQKATDENIDAYLDGLYGDYETKKPFSVIFDLTNAPIPNPKYIKKQAEWMKEHEELISTYCLGVAYVMDNVLFRLALKMVFSIQKNPMPFKVFENMEDATTWAEELHTLVPS